MLLVYFCVNNVLCLLFLIPGITAAASPRVMMEDNLLYSVELSSEGLGPTRTT